MFYISSNDVGISDILGTELSILPSSTWLNPSPKHIDIAECFVFWKSLNYRWKIQEWD